MAVNCPGNIFGAGSHFHGHHRFCDHFGDPRADHVHAKNPVGPGMGKDFDAENGDTENGDRSIFLTN